MAGKTRSRAWNFTIDDYTGVPASLPAGTRRLIVGEEVAPDGTARLRGYVVFDNPKMSPHKHFLEYGRGTFSAAGGDRDENIERCKRGGNYREFGGPGKRGGGSEDGDEWERCWQLARRGKFEEIPPEKRIKHLSTWLTVQSKFGARLDCIGKLDNLWIHGPSGSGKSRWVNLTYPRCYRKLNTKWWDGYSVVDPDHKVVLCEDLHPDTWDVLPQLKVWADHYPFRAETKGSSLTIRPEKIVVTSNYTPERCFARREDVAAVRRRFTVLTVERLPPPRLPAAGTRQEVRPDSSREETREEHGREGPTDGETSEVGVEFAN